MNEPSPKFCYLPFRKNSYKKEIMREFGKLLMKELTSNPDGVQLPNPFGKLIILGHKYHPKTRVNINYKFDNAKTDGQIFGVFLLPKVNLFKKMRNFRLKELKIFRRRIELYHSSKDIIFEMVNNDEWMDHNMYDDYAQLMNVI